MNGTANPYQVQLPMPQPQQFEGQTALPSGTAVADSLYNVKERIRTSTIDNLQSNTVKHGSRVLYYGGIAACTFHGYRRNSSILWSLAWALSATVLPIITPAIALAQGFGKPKKRKR